jgi:hypothetical protein
MNLPEPIPKQFSTLINDIESGRLKIPQFQRNFVWEIKKSANLLDSIIKGYPIGTFIFWKTKERLRSIRNIGNLDLPEPERGDFVNYVLDGQQRITSLFAALKGLTVLRNGKEEDFSKIFVDLTAKEDEKIVTVDVEDENSSDFIKLTDLLYGGLTLLSKYPKEYHKKLEEYKKRIEAYNYSVIQVNNVPIDVATEIFTRINVGGKPLSLFEIMVAKTFDVESNFDLAEKFNELIERLKLVNYETISDATVLQTVSILLKKECKRKVILKLDKQEFINIWNDAIDSIEKAVEYFRNFYRIPVSQLLPYNALIVPFAYFFYHHKDKPTGDKQRYLQDFFWRCALSGRYSSAVESKLAQDIKRIDKILNNELPKYDWPIDTSKSFLIDNGWFSAGRSYIKAILCILAYHQPKSFIDNSIVNISNYWLKQANSKNYHHFFPRAYLKKLNVDEDKINHIINITIVDDFLNKRKIKDKAPSKYMLEFKKKNPNLDECMKTHLINLDYFGIWNDDYNLFFEKRAELISKEIEKRIIKQEIDSRPQANLEYDTSEEIEIE